MDEMNEDKVNEDEEEVDEDEEEVGVEEKRGQDWGSGRGSRDLYLSISLAS